MYINQIKSFICSAAQK